MRETTVWRVGFAGVVLEHRGYRLCIDVVSDLSCTARLYTHDHPRHYGGHRATAAPFTGTRPGDTIDLGWAKVLAVPAYNVGGEPHPRGCCLGFIVEIGGLRVYYAGDTDLVPEIASLPRPDLAVLPIGGGSVMEAEEAAEVVKTLRPAVVVPVHYDSRKSYWVFRDIAQPYTQVVDLRPVKLRGGPSPPLP
jgi:L-ascorbate metabolism protein UlaG (beta-lactamase superfamily)